MLLCKVKKEWFYQEKKNQIYFQKQKKKKLKRLLERGFTFMR